MPAADTKPLLLIVDDHPIYRYGLARALAGRFDLIEANSLGEALGALRGNARVALALVDLRLPDTHGMEALHALTRECGDVPRVDITGDDDPALPARARAAGASGFLHKSLTVDFVAAALLRVLDGGTAFAAAPATAAAAPGASPDLSLRELEVLAMVERGMTNKQIASRLAITERTVKAHIAAADGARLAAEEATRDKARFLAASHDLRQPLHALGLLVSALRDTRPAASQLPLIERMGAGVGVLERLFHDLLDMSRLDSGAVKASLRAVTAGELADAARASFEASAICASRCWAIWTPRC